MNFRFLDSFLLLVLISIVFFKGSTLGDPGVGWHLKNGEVIFTNFEIPKTDLFLATAQPLFWISDQWVADVVFYLLLSVGGFSLLHLGCAVLPIITYGIIIGREVIREAPSQLSALLILMLVFTNGSMQWFCRPVLFSFLFFALFYKWMRDFSANSYANRFPWLCAKVFLLFLAWANLHPAFALSAIIFFSCFFEIVCKSRNFARKAILHLTLLGAVALVATSINPYGIALHQSIVSLVSSDFFMKLNSEWLPPSIGNNFFIVFFLAIGIVGVTLAILPLRQSRPFDLCAVLILACLSLMQRRYIPFFAIPLALFLATSMRALAEGKGRFALRQLPVLRLILKIDAKKEPEDNLLLSKIFVACSFIFILLKGHLPFKSDVELGFVDTFPKKAASYLQQQMSDNAIFATPDWGGFLIWHLWPRYRIFIDDRNTLIGEQRYQDFFSIRDAKPDWEKLIREYKIGFLLLKPKDKLIAELKHSQDWRFIEQGSDNTAVLFGRNESTLSN